MVIEDQLLSPSIDQMKIMILIVVVINLAVVVLNLEIHVIETVRETIDLDQFLKQVIVLHQDHRMIENQVPMIRAETKAGLGQDLEAMVFLSSINMKEIIL